MKWEYMEAPVHAETWKDLGRAGWELVAIYNGHAYFKRQVKK